MPSVNVRLSDELHAVLVARAAASGRSLQQQIIVTLDGRVSAVPSAAEVDRLAAEAFGRVADKLRPGLGSGEVKRAASPPLTVAPSQSAAAVSPVPSPPAGPEGVLVAPGSSPGPSEKRAKRGDARGSAGSCPADTPKGVRCKLCGNVH